MSEHEELAQWLYRLADERSCNRLRGIRPHPSALRRAAALLQQAAPAPMPAAPTPDDFRRWWRETGSNDFGPTPEMLLTANAWAEAWAAMRQPAPVLVPVAERPWERPGWCDAEGRCCWLAPNQSWPCLYLMKVDSALAAQVATHCLPHWFIPIPIPQPPQGDPLMQCGHPNGCTCVLLHGFTHPDPLCAWASAQTQPPQGGEVEP